MRVVKVVSEWKYVSSENGIYAHIIWKFSLALVIVFE